jgi:gluconate kinase
MSDHYVRPQTPQAMLHRLPDKPEAISTEATRIPSKYIILITASTAVAGKAQIAKSVASAIGCPLFQGDSLHETAARAASVGPPKGDEAASASASSGANEGRYQRMWLSKMTRTGYLFPDESRPANEGFSGFGGGAPAPSSTSTSRRGSGSSVASVASSAGPGTGAGSSASSYMSGPPPGTTKFINKPPPTTTLSAEEKSRRANPALMVTTHPVLEQWHKDSIRHVVGEYGIGVIFVPLDQDDELPVLKPLDPRTMTSFGSLGSFGNAQLGAAKPATLDEEIVLTVDTDAKVEDLIDEIVDGVRDLMTVTDNLDQA